MPLVKLKHILSFTSEDPIHKAENLLKDDSSHKWKCSAGEKQASVIFQLEKSSCINSIDIGNDGSAFIEILVGRNADVVQYQVLLVASSFMSPQESRHGSATNKVRMFTKDKLSPEIVGQKWDIVKVVCTQPFNKRVPYGLSFIKFHSISDFDDADQTEKENIITKDTIQAQGKPTVKKFGNFSLNPSEEKDKYQPGITMSLYQASKKEITSNEHKKERISKPAETTSSETKRISKESRRRSHSPDKHQASKRKKTPVIGKPVVIKDTQNKSFDDQVKKVHLPKSPRRSNPEKVISASRTPPSSNAKTRTASNPSPASKVQTNKPYNKILDNVLFVLSGFQNPLRSEIREMALGMGAQYRRDWTPDSTHLVCAFANTPKFSQVSKSGGKIVKKEWVFDCARKKQLLPWKNYCMNSSPPDSSSSDEEEQAAVMQKEVKDISISQSSLQKSEPRTDFETDRKKNDDPYEASTDEEEAGDTDDEIQKIQDQQRSDRTSSNIDTDKNIDDDIYNASTDDEVHDSEDDSLPFLPNYFQDKRFFLYGKLPPDVKRLVIRHIISSGGHLSKYMSADLHFVVTEQDWNRKFDEALAENTGLIFVRPSWIFDCSSQMRLLSYQSYEVELQ